MKSTSAILLMVVAVGCTTVSVREHPLPDRAQLSSVREEGGVWVGAEPYSDAERQRSYLGEDFGPIGAIPVLVILRNNGPASRLLRPQEIRLRLRNGMSTTETGPEISSSFSRQPGSNAEGAAAVFGLVGAIAALSVAASESKAARVRAENFSRKSLRRGVMNPGETWHGFVYFMLPEKTPAFADAAILLSLTDTNGGDPVTIEVPIKLAPFPNFPARN